MPKIGDVIRHKKGWHGTVEAFVDSDGLLLEISPPDSTATKVVHVSEVTVIATFQTV